MVLVVLPAERERQEIVAAFHVDEREQPADGADVPDDVVFHLGAAHRLPLLRVPALRLDEFWQHLGFEAAAQLLGHADAPGHDLVAEEAGPAVEQHQHRCFLVHQHLLVPVGRRRVLREAEPVERVRR